LLQSWPPMPLGHGRLIEQGEAGTLAALERQK
jgi:hypothetical protein